MTKQTMPPWQYGLGVGFAGLLTVGGAAMIIFGVNFVQEALAAKQWPVVAGEIKSVQIIREVDRNGSTRVETHHLKITYDYQMDGNAYTGDRYSLGDGSTASKRFNERSKAIAEKNKYPIGSAIDVFYKPTEPSLAILKPGVNFGTAVPIILGFIFLSTGLSLLILVIRN
ncbi:DUF3592 domain-containing protein [Synechocystis salina]|uniref:DUF3592 domain-containing protein n=1 Tax=Synechocystis salina LEGE 00031 TaxID=1828736 RepID=A0ABR9VQD1_9SYNC|nr:DUF3592 domain-containing protein [Synechocystis salina]MBE9240294.1 DUF3592 domain-containing protein [Synechocystis salina LEGE 00041]MBE9253527.1 DUF3592 domain-containing protein [Synechocystis salina LEGE 00031]